VKHLRSVPHSLNATQKMERVTLSIKLLRQLGSIEHHGWQFINTLDESWFNFSTDHGYIWLRQEEESPERPRYTIQYPKTMVIIARNSLGFHLIKALSKGMSFNAEYYRDNIVTELLPTLPQADGRRLVLHADNARVHTARKCQACCTEIRLGSAAHPPYSPDLALSDFFLFGDLKHLLQGVIIASRKELFAAIHEIVAGIRQETLRRVFQHWMERLE
jgi:hypothetical protein